MEKPFFSIITPVYNCEKYIRECIESVINQTYPLWELILVDDGSTDASGDICDEFSNDPRVKVIHQKNAGELNSRWNGMVLASGKYELGLDADDYLDLNCLERVKKAIDVSGSDLILFGLRLVGNRKGNSSNSLPGDKEYSQKEILKIVIGEANTSLCNKAIRLDKVKKTKIGLKEGPRFNLDYALIIPILCNINTGYVINDILYNYRIHGNSISDLCKMQHVLDTGVVTEYVIQTLKTSLLLDADMYRLINIFYLNTLCHRLLGLFINKSITKEDCKYLHQSSVYMNSKQVETLKNFHYYKFMILKMFRYKQYWILKLFVRVRRLWQSDNI